MWVVVLHPYTKFEVRKLCDLEDIYVCVSMCVSINLPDLDLLTFKLVRESHLRRGTFLPNLGTLGL